MSLNLGMQGQDGQGIQPSEAKYGPGLGPAKFRGLSSLSDRSRLMVRPVGAAEHQLGRSLVGG